MMNFKLDPKSGIPFYKQVSDQIRYGIATGALQVGEQLPTVRALAVELSVNPNTISKAYRELEIRNVLVSQHGTGTFVGPKAKEIPAQEKRQKLQSICDEFIAIAGSYGFAVEEIISELSKRKGEKK